MSFKFLRSECFDNIVVDDINYLFDSGGQSSCGSVNSKTVTDAPNISQAKVSTKNKFSFSILFAPSSKSKATTQNLNQEDFGGFPRVSSECSLGKRFNMMNDRNLNRSYEVSDRQLIRRERRYNCLFRTFKVAIATLFLACIIWVIWMYILFERDELQ